MGNEEGAKEALEELDDELSNMVEGVRESALYNHHRSM